MSQNPWATGQNESSLQDTAQTRRSTSGPISTSTLQEGDVGPISNDVAGTRYEATEWGSSTTPFNNPPTHVKPGANRPETNPFLLKRTAGSQENAPTQSFAKLDLDETNNPWQPALGSQSQNPSASINHISPSLIDEDDRNAWATGSERPASPSPVLVSVPSEGESPSWDTPPLRRDEKAPTPPMKIVGELDEGTNIWGEDGMEGKGKTKVTAPTEDELPSERGLPGATSSASDENRVEADDPPLPPKEKAEFPAWGSSRQPVDGKSETYQVKNIRWSGVDAGGSCTSPILVQNANGPCPLVALVNALTLTTPADVQDTTLVEVLRSREQVSLSLLLDAVFDELMSPRRTSSEDALPDVSDLYAFLQSLHTGMNVNPRFIPTENMVNAYKRTSLTHLHPTERGDLIPGTFENTAEMSLYATFSIPLVHGWLPLKSEPAYESLERQAPSYEDAQNLLFREEELEIKLSDAETGLTESEQQLYQDLMLIKEFLEVSATQLTQWGIEVISKAIRPGTFAILFRNDHFSTLYCHPQTRQLLTLVTDAGYKTHDEIVWETLSDVHGGQTKFLSGNIQVVGSSEGTSSTDTGVYHHDSGGEWTMVQTRRNRSQQDDENIVSPNTEQEDRDLALALQLQEEEEERHRADEARRRRESLLSEQFIEQQAQQPTPVSRGGRGATGASRGGSVARGRGGFVPGRTSSQSAPTTNTTNVQARPAQQVVRSLIPPQRQGVTRAADNGSEEAPPSYEQSANDPTYQPSQGQAGHASNPPGIARQGTRTSSNTHPAGQRLPGPPAGRRPPMGLGGATGNANGQVPQRERDCVVM